MTLTEEQYDRYTRHILLRGIGAEGQERLLAASVAVDVGAESAAEIAAIVYLAAAGVGRIVLGGGALEPVTEAEVAAGLAYGGADVGRPRIEAIRDRVCAVNPDVSVVAAVGSEHAARRLSRISLAGPVDLARALVHGCAAATRLLAELARSPDV